MKGADSAKEENKMHEGIIKCERRNKGLRRRIKGTRVEEEMQMLRWDNERCR